MHEEPGAVAGAHTEPDVHPAPSGAAHARAARRHASGATEADGLGAHEPTAVSSDVTCIVWAPEHDGTQAPAGRAALLQSLAHDESKKKPTEEAHVAPETAPQVQPHVAAGASGSARPSNASAANGAAHAPGAAAGAPVVARKRPGPVQPEGAAATHAYPGRQSGSSQSTRPSQSSSMPFPQSSGPPHPSCGPPDDDEPDDEPDEPEPDDEPDEPEPDEPEPEEDPVGPTEPDEPDDAEPDDVPPSWDAMVVPLSLSGEQIAFSSHVGSLHDAAAATTAASAIPTTTRRGAIRTTARSEGRRTSARRRA
jgi:hypothetical protein